MSIGTPPQDLAFEVIGAYNNTYIYDSYGPCSSGISSLACAINVGGLYSQTLSSSWNQVSSQDAAGGSSDIALTMESSEPFVKLSNATWATELVTLNSDSKLTSFPLAVPGSEGLHMNAIGLGENSTFLNALYNTGQIAAKTWSIFWGLEGDGYPSAMDGLLVLGGYDEAKVTGSNFTGQFSYTTDCASHMVVTVSDIEMDFNNGTTISLQGESRGTALEMCLQPDYEIITIPYDYWEIFLINAGGTYLGRTDGLHDYGEQYAADGGVYAGDLILTLASGLSFRILNSQLAIPDATINNEGTIVVNNATKEIALNSLQSTNGDDLPILGQTFLSAAYLLVEPEAKNFILWQSQRQTTQNLVVYPSPSCTSATLSPTSSLAANPTSSSSSTNPPITSSTPSHSNKGLSTGAIAGIAIGTISAIALLASTILLLLRRKRKHRSPNPPPREDPPSEKWGPTTPNDILIAEAPDTQVPSELPTEQQRQATGPFELPSRRFTIGRGAL